MATYNHVLCANFVKFGWPEIGKVVRYLLDKKISARFPALSSAWIAPKISSKSVHFRRSYSRTREHRSSAPQSVSNTRKVWKHSVVNCAKTAEPIVMPFGLWTWVGCRKHKFNRMHQVAPTCIISIVFARWRQCTWRHSAVSCTETAEPIDLPFSVVDLRGPKEAQVQSYSPGVANVLTWEDRLVPPGEYAWTFHVRRRCGLMSLWPRAIYGSRALIFEAKERHPAGPLPGCGNVVKFYNAGQRGLSVSPAFWGEKICKFYPTVGR